jgi:DNA replication protein DnaC
LNWAPNLNNILAHRRALGPLIGQLHLTRGAELLQLEVQQPDCSRIRSTKKKITAESNRQLAREIKHYQSPRILLIDELGYLPLDKRGAELLFQVITKRYERGSIIITTNIAFKDWPRIFAGDATMTSALLDRLLHHAQPVVIEGDSYRSAKRK